VRGIEIALPRLAARVGDLPLLAQHVLNLSRALVPRSPVTEIGAEADEGSSAWVSDG
jgi:hypothetical protein